jgi:hypothetical protein
MVYTDIYRRDADDKIDFYTRQELSRAGSPANLSEKLRVVIATPEYQSLPRALQQDMLETAATAIVKKAKDNAKNRLRAQAKRRGDPYSRVEIAKWDSLSTEDKNQINEVYQLYEGFEGRTVGEDMDMMVEIGGRKVNVLQWAIHSALPLVQGGIK